jgi:ferritin-like metal-binding protein YciE
MAEVNTLRSLFIDELRDVYDAERQIVKELPHVIEAASSDNLKAALEEHLEVTHGQVDRLEEVFEKFDLKARGKHCSGMEGILEEGKDLIGNGYSGSALDAGLIAAAQRVEHYEISAYGTLVAWARQLGHEDVVDLLEQSLAEEKTADQDLTELAETVTNPAAEGAATRQEGF